MLEPSSPGVQSSLHIHKYLIINYMFTYIPQSISGLIFVYLVKNIGSAALSLFLFGWDTIDFFKQVSNEQTLGSLRWSTAVLTLGLQNSMQTLLAISSSFFFRYICLHTLYRVLHLYQNASSVSKRLRICKIPIYKQRPLCATPR